MPRHCWGVWPALPTSDYYGGSVPSCDQQPTAGLPATGLAGRREGRSQGGSHVHHEPVDGIGVQLFPCSLATGTPQPFPVASRSAERQPTLESPLPNRRQACTADRPRSTRLEPAELLSGVPPLVPALVRLSGSLAEPGPSGGAGPSGRCRGCFPPSLAPPRSGCPQLRRAAATAQRRSPFISTRSHGASWRTRSTFQRWRPSRVDGSSWRRAIRGQIPRRRSSLRQLHVASSHVAHDVAAPTLRGR